MGSSFSLACSAQPREENPSPVAAGTLLLGTHPSRGCCCPGAPHRCSVPLPPSLPPQQLKAPQAQPVGLCHPCSSGGRGSHTAPGAVPRSRGSTDTPQCSLWFAGSFSLAIAQHQRGTPEYLRGRPSSVSPTEPVPFCINKYSGDTQLESRLSPSLSIPGVLYPTGYNHSFPSLLSQRPSFP